MITLHDRYGVVVQMGIFNLGDFTRRDLQGNSSSFLSTLVARSRSDYDQAGPKSIMIDRKSVV